MDKPDPKTFLPGGAVFCDKEHVAELKKSMEILGCLQPIVVADDTGEILLGKHRKNTGFPVEVKTLHIKSEVHRELAYVHGNKQRQVKDEEVKFRFLRLAMMFEQLGVPEHLWSVVNPSNEPKIAEMLKGKIPRDKVREVIQSLVPYSEVQVRRYLPSEYKMMSKARDQSGQVCDHVIAKTSLADAPPGTVSELGSQLGSLTEGSDEPAFPFKDCRCQGCPNEGKCY